MSKVMTTNVGHLGVLTRPEKQAKPLGNYWKALVPIVVGATLFFLPIPGGSLVSAAARCGR